MVRRMSNHLRIPSRRPSAPLVISSIALIASLAGTAFAAGVLPAGSVGADQLRNWSITAPKVKPGAITAPKLAANAIDSSKVADRSLQAEDFAAGQLPAGAQGAPGTARAYAQVNGGASPSFVTTATKDFTKVVHAATGTYCLTPAAGISPTAHPAVVSVPPNGATESAAIAAVEATAAPAGCVAGDYRVVTSRIYPEAMGGPLPADDVPFAIIVA